MDQHAATGPAPQAPPSGALTQIDITFDSRGDRLIGLGALNAVLKVLSLGLYSFWAKTEVRRRVWSFTRLNGEPLQYTGTGKELFLGFLVVFFLFVLPLTVGGIAVMMLFPTSQIAITIYYLLVYGLFFLLIGNAIYRAQRYRMSRTEWRGIRADLTGSPWRYGWTYFWTLALPGLTALGLAYALMEPLDFEELQAQGGTGVIMALYASRYALLALLAGAALIALILPWRSNILQRQMTNGMAFGDVRLTYDGSPGPLYKRYLLAAAGGLAAFALALAATGLVAGPMMPDDAGQMDVDFMPSNLGLKLAAIWIAFTIALAVLSAWYRASQMIHFARNTRLGQAQFRATPTGPGLAWLALSNWLLVLLATMLGAGLGLSLAYGLNALPLPDELGNQPSQPPIAFNLIVILSIVLFTTVATTFAQFRSARYFLSRLKLDGPVDLAAIQQSATTGPKRGEGLAQVFDLDAF